MPSLYCQEKAAFCACVCACTHTHLPRSSCKYDLCSSRSSPSINEFRSSAAGARRVRRLAEPTRRLPQLFGTVNRATSHKMGDFNSANHSLLVPDALCFFNRVVETLGTFI